MLPGGRGGAGVQGGEEVGVQTEEQECTVQYRKNGVFANRAGHFIY